MMTNEISYTFGALISVDGSPFEDLDVSDMGNSIEEILAHLKQRARDAADTRGEVETSPVETSRYSLSKTATVYFERERDGELETVEIEVTASNHHPPYQDAPVGDQPIILYADNDRWLGLTAAPNLPASETPDVTIGGVPCLIGGSREYTTPVRRMLRSGKAAGLLWDGVDGVSTDHSWWGFTDTRDTLGDVLGVMVHVVGPRHVRNEAASEAFGRAMPWLELVYGGVGPDGSPRVY